MIGRLFHVLQPPPPPPPSPISGPQLVFSPAAWGPAPHSKLYPRFAYHLQNDHQFLLKTFYHSFLRLYMYLKAKYFAGSK